MYDEIKIHFSLSKFDIDRDKPLLSLAPFTFIRGNINEPLCVSSMCSTHRYFGKCNILVSSTEIVSLVRFVVTMPVWELNNISLPASNQNHQYSKIETVLEN